MTKIELLDAAEKYTYGKISQEDFLTAVDAYSSASNDGKPIVSGAFYCWHSDATSDESCAEQCEECKATKFTSVK